MIYEVYADLLWAELFFWNLYGLVMTDFRLWNPAGKGRKLLGASAGACCMSAAFWVPGRWLRTIGMIGGLLIMLLLTFRIRRLKVFLMVFRMYVSSLLLLGGVMLAIYRILFAGLKYGKIPAVLLGGAVVTGGYVLMKRRELRSGRQFEGRAFLKHRGMKIRAMAVIDSGNALAEPFSGEPVCVLLGAEEEELRMDGELYRVVPYQCVGKTKGILKAYRMEKILLDFDGPEKVLQGVYVAFGEPDSEKKGRILLIPPGILQKKGKIAKGRQNCGRTAKLQADCNGRKRYEKSWERSEANETDVYG
ncbi:MAG: sigma-E processing peptidase SpoIIGA [Lachnospiraceae bacterium]|nr:sigma-E processing peptidase SpoIIGA [Lachnospiraceae bacterium]